MRHTTLAAALALTCTFGQHALSQQWLSPELRNDKLVIDYREPIDPKFLNLEPDDSKYRDEYRTQKDRFDRITAVYERLKGLQLLERFSQFLSPLNLPVTLRLVTRQCGPADDELTSYFSPGERSINLCYELVRDFEDQAPQSTTPEGITRLDAVIGSIVSTMLHESGHAVYNLLQVPVLGREEDAADQIAAYTMLQFDHETARTTIKGAAWKWYSRDWTGAALWDVHSTAPQRLASYLCVAYGKEPTVFQDFVDAGWLPAGRAPNCRREYEQVHRAFTATVLPHMDREKLRRVLASPWLSPTTFK